MKERGFPVVIAENDCTNGAIGAISSMQNTGWATSAILLLVLLISLIALFFAFRKSAVIQETYTEYKKRSSSFRAKPNSSSNAPGDPVLVIKGETTIGQKIQLLLRAKRLNGGDSILGREAGCDLIIDDPTVSRRHALLKFRNGKLKVEDLNSKNGTWVDGRRVSSETFSMGSPVVITFGKVKLRIYGENS